jgi:hypothetical protein
VTYLTTREVASIHYLHIIYQPGVESLSELFVMATTQIVEHEEIELQTPGMTPSTSKTFDLSDPTPAQSTTNLQASFKGDRPRNASESPERGPDDEPAEGAVEVAPEGGYGWVVVGACSVCM